MVVLPAAPKQPPVRRFLSVFLADASVMHQPNVQLLLMARALASAGMALLTYGAMTQIARTGGSQFDVSVVGAAGSLAALGFGLRGGELADSLSRSLAVGLSSLAQALLCFLVPTLLGVSLAPLVLLILAISILSQVTTPALKTAVAVVASAPEVATVAVLLGVADAVGSAAGTAGLAPALIKISGMTAVAYVSGCIFVLMAVRAFRVPGTRLIGAANKLRRSRPARARTLGVRDTGTWIFGHSPVATMILIGAAVTVLSHLFDTLQPVFTRSVLHQDPVISVYIFAPGALGTVIGTVAAPQLMRKSSERVLAIWGLIAFGLGMTLFGLIDVVTPMLAPLSPIRLLAPLGISVSDGVLAAGVIAIPIQFGATAAATAVQTYINRRVPVVGQGTTFGMQTVLTSALNIVILLGLGALATVIGVKWMFFLAPGIVVLLVVAMLGWVSSAGSEEKPTWGEVFASFWEDPTTEGEASLAAPGP